MTRLHQLVLAAVAAVIAVVLVREGTVSEETALIVLALIVSVILHEVAHGVTALGFGDDTARRAGRLTLNPVAHVDPIGTIVLPVVLAIASQGTATFGYAKPVPVNARRMRNPRNHGLLVSLAGPGLNVVLALLTAVAWRGLGLDTADEESRLAFFVEVFGIVNVVLAVFNMLPVPPLDGSAVVERFLPMRYWQPYLRFRQYSVVLLLLLVFAFPLERLFDPAIELWQRLL